MKIRYIFIYSLLLLNNNFSNQLKAQQPDKFKFVEYFNLACDYSLAKKIDSADILLRESLKYASADNLNSYLFDLDIDTLRKSKYWHIIHKILDFIVKKKYPNIDYEYIALLNRVHLLNRIGGLAKVKESQKLFDSVVSAKGLPFLSRVTKYGSKVVKLICVHYVDTFSDKKYLKLANDLLEKGELDSSEYPYIIDRYNIARNLPQIYGTNCIESSNNVLEFYPIIDILTIESRRKKFGLISILEEIELNEKVNNYVYTNKEIFDVIRKKRK
ncbi:MAG: DUF6624 domain-containing protein [Chitinophagales bacterium]